MGRAILRRFVWLVGVLAGCLPALAVVLPPGQVTTGTISAASQTNSYTFAGSAGNVVIFTAAGSGISPAIYLYNSKGVLLTSARAVFANGNCDGGATVELSTFKLPANDTYTVDINDCSLTNAGNYSLYFQFTNAPAGSVTLPYAQTTSGSIASSSQSNTYTISATAGDLLDFTLVGSGISPKLRIYDASTGGLLTSTAPLFANGNCDGGATIELNSFVVPNTGSYTILVGDCSDVNSGNYEVYIQRTDNPSGPSILSYGQTKSDSITAPAQSNTYTFSANAGDYIDFTLAGSGISPKIRLL